MTASTERPPGAAIPAERPLAAAIPGEHRLTEAHLAGALALTRSANWNQNEADWRLMLSIGRGWGITAADGTLAASTLVLPYLDGARAVGGSFAWVSMVLVSPQHRRKGYASQLLRTAIADLQSKHLTPILDATPAGHEVYVQEGFHDTWGFRRYALKQHASAPSASVGVRPLEERDWPRVLELDRIAFGAIRESLLRALAARLPQAAWVAEHGFLLGRDGHEACQLGPLVAQDADTAKALLCAALSRVPAPLYVDVADHAAGLRAWLESLGFAFQRPFTRMVHGASGAPGDESKVMLVAGPELG